jgi:urea transporter
VYTEGLFLGLAFMACALAVEKKLVWAAVFAVVAAVTRQAGFVSPLGQNWQIVEREFFGRSFDLAGSIDMVLAGPHDESHLGGR